MTTKFCVAAAVLLSLSACGGGGGGGGAGGQPGPSPSGGTVNPETVCTNNAMLDSTISVNTVTRIVAHQSTPAPRYGTMTVRHKANGDAVTMDYMVHEAVGTPKAVVVLIAGGALDAGITGTGSTVLTSGANFLVRSAHLFAAQGFRVITLDRPNDYLDYTGGSAAGIAYDGYRLSAAHGVDIAAVASAENTTNLPIIIAGTSRGAISAVAQSGQVSAIMVSAPVTSGMGWPVGSNALPRSAIRAPLHVLWHSQDACALSTPSGARDLALAVPGATGDPVSGGFNDPTEPDPCQARTLHGFLGIESCAVSRHTNWLDSLGLALTGPVANAVNTATAANTSTQVDLAGATAPGAGGTLAHTLPSSTSVLGGAVSIAGTMVTYTPPGGVSGSTDRFVYAVRESNGAIRHNIVAVSIGP